MTYINHELLSTAFIERMFFGMKCTPWCIIGANGFGCGNHDGQCYGSYTGDKYYTDANIWYEENATKGCSDGNSEYHTHLIDDDPGIYL